MNRNPPDTIAAKLLAGAFVLGFTVVALVSAWRLIASLF